MAIQKIKENNLFLKSILISLIIHLTIIKSFIFVFSDIKDSPKTDFIFLGKIFYPQELFNNFSQLRMANSLKVKDSKIFNKNAAVSIDKPLEIFLHQPKIILKSLDQDTSMKPKIKTELSTPDLETTKWPMYKPLKFKTQ